MQSPCYFWQHRSARAPSDSWIRSAHRICVDYHNAQLQQQPVSDRLAAGQLAISEFKQLYDDTVDAAVQQYVNDKNSIHPPTSVEYLDQLAEQTGLIDIIRALENGY